MFLWKITINKHDTSLTNHTACIFVSDSKGEAAAIETELLRDYKFGQQQLIEIWGQACALSITKVCTPSDIQISFVVGLFAFAGSFLSFFPSTSL